jgi:steroid delta-isomerase-like uncharacterized protein
MSIVDDFAAAFNRNDVDALLACFTDDATYVDNFYGEHSGQPSLRGMFQRMFREGMDYSWKMDVVVNEPTRAAAEWRFGYTATAAVPRSVGRRVQFRGMSVFELRGGRIERYREYWDTGKALLQLGFAPEAIAKVLRRSAPD